MFKPLLRTIPNLSGNFTLCCQVDDIYKIGNNDFESNIQNAFLRPLDDNLYNKDISISLLYDNYEYNVAKYYDNYNSSFYYDSLNDNYDVDTNKSDIIDFVHHNDSRNETYEFGCRRNIINDNYNFIFYAPFYIDNEESLPDEFVIVVKRTNGKNKVFDKKIHININKYDSYINRSNYLIEYLKKYTNKIDDKCIFAMPDNNQAIVYGIDVEHGGLQKYKDNVFAKIFKKQLTINEYDKTISESFKRTSSIMRQIIPMSFVFNINKILSSSENEITLFNKVQISGYYVKNGIRLDFYDFDTNYVKLDLNGYNILNPEITDDDNHNINLDYSLYEAKNINVKNDNKINKTYNRWCLLSTVDKSEPYIVNSSPVFNDENNNYYNTPINYSLNYSYLHYDDTTNDIDLSYSFNYLKTNYLNNIITETKYSEENILKENNWHDVYNNKVIINGLLLDLNKLSYIEEDINYGNSSYHFDRYRKIDKFNIFAYINICKVDDVEIAKYSINEYDPSKFNSISYNNYSYSLYKYFFLDDTAYTDKNFKKIYANSHNKDVLFKKIAYKDVDDSMYTNLYADYSYHYYLSNIYENVTCRDTNINIDNDALNSLKSDNKFTATEIRRETELFDFNINIGEFVKKASTYIEEHPESKVSQMLKQIKVYENNIKSGVNIDEYDSSKTINKIGIEQYFADVTKYWYENRVNDGNSYVLKYIASSDKELEEERLNKTYYHYIPYSKDFKFESSGHFEKTRIHRDYLYVDAWNLEEYIKWYEKYLKNNSKKFAATTYELNKLKTLLSRIKSFYSSDYYDKHNKTEVIYSGFMNEDHYLKRKEMYGNLNIYELKYEMQINPNKSFIKVAPTLSPVVRPDSNEAVSNYKKLYKLSKLYRVNEDLLTFIISTYSILERNCGDQLSLILYSTYDNEKHIVDGFNLNNDDDNFYLDSFSICKPLTHEIIYSNKSQDETYEILSDYKIKIHDCEVTTQDWTGHQKYVYYDNYNLINVNKIGSESSLLSNINDDKSIKNKLYIKEKDTVISDNTIHFDTKNGKTYAYYYMTLNLYPNEYSFLMDLNDTFKLENYKLNDIFYYIKTNIYNYLLNNIIDESIIAQNTIKINIDKTFDDIQMTDVNTPYSFSLSINRYFGDITPVLIQTNLVKRYSKIFKTNMFISKMNNILSFAPKSINGTENIQIPYINQSAKIPSYNDIEEDENNELPSNILTHYEYEHKFFNNNELYFLKSEFEIVYKDLVVEDELEERKVEKYILDNIFIPYVNIYLKYTDDKIQQNYNEFLFLFDCYIINYTSEFKQMNFHFDKKMYKLTYTFKLKNKN